MIRGTTPTLEFTLPFEVSILEDAYVTLAQKGIEVLSKRLGECSCDKNKLVVTLKQEETLLLCCDYKTEIQIRAKTLEGAALASQILTVDTERILKDGVI